MTEQDKVGRYCFLAEPFHCDFSDRLFMGHLGNHMLNAADFHSNERGFGMHYLNTIHKTWVISRLTIEMEEMPPAYTKMAIETWVENAARFFTNRNFMVCDADTGRIFGYGKSVWAMIDTDSRQPADLFAINNGRIADYVVADKLCPIEKSGRVKMSPAAEHIRTIHTYYNDVDINGHINSIKYIEHVLDLWPIAWYHSHRLRRFEVAYVAEAHGGDQLAFYREEAGDGEYNIRINKATPEGEVEVCRCKVLFCS